MHNETLVVKADLSKPAHCDAILKIIDSYAADIMGGGEPLDASVKKALIPALRAHPTTIIFLAFEGQAAIGVAVCFLGFSTFAARPLINVHDLAVVPEKRGHGVGKALLKAVEAEALGRNCCKITLEVLEGNARARGLYEREGFAQASYADGMGGALFYAKPLEVQAAFPAQ